MDVSERREKIGALKKKRDKEEESYKEGSL